MCYMSQYTLKRVTYHACKKWRPRRDYRSVQSNQSTHCQRILSIRTKRKLQTGSGNAFTNHITQRIIFSWYGPTKQFPDTINPYLHSPTMFYVVSNYNFFRQTVQIPIKHCVCNIWLGSTLFAQVIYRTQGIYGLWSFGFTPASRIIQSMQGLESKPPHDPRFKICNPAYYWNATGPIQQTNNPTETQHNQRTQREAGAKPSNTVYSRHSPTSA